MDNPLDDRGGHDSVSDNVRFRKIIWRNETSLGGIPVTGPQGMVWIALCPANLLAGVIQEE